MIIRIVKLELLAEHLDLFVNFFERHQEEIKRSPGCVYLQLLQDVDTPSRWFTYSHWESESHLQQYRQSEFFKEVWSEVKVWFAAKPEAWTLSAYNAIMK